MAFSEREKVFSADLSEIENIRNFVFSGVEGLSTGETLHLELALEEIVVNICQYAYDVPPGEIIVKVSDSEDCLSVEFVDRGVPFDPLSTNSPDIKKPLLDRDQGGLGILLMRRLMDEVHYSRIDGANLLRIKVLKK